MSDLQPPTRTTHRALGALAVLFGSLYFVQGVVEPTAGLLTQPLQSQLQLWGRTPEQIGFFLGFISLPWSFKPLFGLISDFLPLGGRRRKPYLVLTTGGAGLAFLTIAVTWSSGSDQARLLAWLLLGASAGVAMTDVVVDALAVETGQPAGLTGQLQSIQWGAMSAATILAGTLGGYVSGHGLQKQAFFGCGLLSFASLLVVLLVVREPPRSGLPSDNLRQAWRQLKSGRRLAILLSVGGFLFLWSFNPFSSNVLQHYTTQVLGLSEQFYGNLSSVQGAAQVVACVAYGLLCRRIPLTWLIHGSIVTGILSTLCYWPMYDAPTAVAASIAFGLTYQTATLIQLDLAARVCPTQSAGTIFALLMAISNTGLSASIWVSGSWYDALAAHWQGNRHAAFHALVLIGAAFTAGCWLLVPLMLWAGVKDEPLAG